MPLFPILAARLHVASLKQLGPSQALLLSLEAHEALGNRDLSSELDHPSLSGAQKSFHSQGFTHDPTRGFHTRDPISCLLGHSDPLSPDKSQPCAATGFSNLLNQSLHCLGHPSGLACAWLLSLSNFPCPPRPHQTRQDRGSPDTQGFLILQAHSSLGHSSTNPPHLGESKIRRRECL